MVRKTQKLTGKPVNQLAPASVPGELSEFPDAMSYINSLSSSREGVDWDLRVYKVEGAGRGVKESMPFLFSVQLEDLPILEETLAGQFPGGGQFRVQCRADNQLVKNIRLDIAARPGWKPEPPVYLRPVTAPAQDNPPTDRFADAMLRLAEMQERSQQQTREMIQALASKLDVKPPTLAEQLATFEHFQKFIPKGVQENSMDLFQKGMDFAAKMFEARGGDGGGATWLDVVRDAINSPELKNALAAGITAAAQQQSNTMPAPALQAPPAFVSPANPIAAQAMDTLIGQAMAGVEPKFVAGQIEGKIPEAFILELEQQEDIVGYICHQFPRAGAHRVWFAALVAEMFEDDNNAGPSPTMANPDANPFKPTA